MNVTINYGPGVVKLSEQVMLLGLGAGTICVFFMFAFLITEEDGKSRSMKNKIFGMSFIAFAAVTTALWAAGPIIAAFGR